MQSKVIVIKLAAIGDVALACRALKDFSLEHDTPIDVYWVIDQNLVSLAQALLDYSPKLHKISVHWIPIDSKKLFQGSILEKITIALSLVKNVLTIQPCAIVSLHRDWRYKALLRTLFTGSFISLQRKRVHELLAYSEALSSLARELKITRRITSAITTNTDLPLRNSEKKIGILIGGAQNQKVIFHEKRWPHMKALVARLAQNPSQTEILFFGSKDDSTIADELIATLPGDANIKNFVGNLSLEQLPAALAKLDAFISIDSGLAHIATTVMTAENQKIVSLFGPTDPTVWAPKARGMASIELLYKGSSCSPCYVDDGRFLPCKFKDDLFQHCMSDISVDDVIKKLALS